MFVDIQGAYDSIDLNILEGKLIENFKFPINLAKLIVNLFTNRSVFIREFNNQLLGPHYNSTGIPQRSILSPILFNLYTTDIHKINDAQFSIVQCADDFCVYTEHKKYNLAINLLTSSITNLEYGFLLMVLIFQQINLQWLYFPDTGPNITNINLGNYLFPFQTHVKYLGVILDKKLKWNLNIENLINRCNKSIHFLKMSTKTWWGADIQTTLIFYKAYIRSILDHGCILYGFTCNTLFYKIRYFKNVLAK